MSILGGNVKCVSNMLMLHRVFQIRVYFWYMKYNFLSHESNNPYFSGNFKNLLILAKHLENDKYYQI